MGLDGMSLDIELDARERLKATFPDCFVEDKLDIDKLLTMCGEYITNDFEKYKFEWKGKAECLQLAQRRSGGTLRPKPDESVDFDTTGNVYIKGDNLEVLKLLQTAYYRQVKMIYIDPPYNGGRGIVFAMYNGIYFWLINKSAIFTIVVPNQFYFLIFPSKYTTSYQ